MRRSASDGVDQLPRTLWEALETQAEIFPDKIAFSILNNAGGVQEAISYRALRDRAETHAAQLAERGCAGRPVILLQSTGLDFVVSFFAVLRCGGAVVPLNARLLLRQTHELEPILKDAAPAAILCDRASVKRLYQIVSELGLSCSVLVVDELHLLSIGVLQPSVSLPSGTAVIQYTSGSTSAPKGVCVTHTNFLANARLLTKTFHADSSDVAVSWLPLFHDMGLMTGIVWPVSEGASAVLLKPSIFAARPISWLKALSDFRGSISSAPNFAFQLCLDRVAPEEAAELDLSSWRVAICGAEPVQPGTVDGFLQRFAVAAFDPEHFFPCYGLAEATLFVTGGRSGGRPRILEKDAKSPAQHGAAEPCFHKINSRHLVGCGAPGEDVGLAIVSPETCQRLPEGTVGEIWIRGPSISPGYLGRTTANRDVFAGRIAGERGAGFLRTGDLGFLDNGDLFVVGRIKDLIIVRGSKHAPQDLELTAAGAHAALKGCRGVAFALEGEGHDGVVILHEVQLAANGQASAIIDDLRRAVAQTHGVAVNAVGLLPARTLPLTSSGRVRRAPSRAAWLAGGLPMLASWRAGNENRTTAENTTANARGAPPRESRVTTFNKSEASI